MHKHVYLCIFSHYHLAGIEWKRDSQRTLCEEEYLSGSWTPLATAARYTSFVCSSSSPLSLSIFSCPSTDAGRLGRLIVNIPWKQLGQKESRIQIDAERIFLVVSPVKARVPQTSPRAPLFLCILLLSHTQASDLSKEELTRLNSLWRQTKFNIADGSDEDEEEFGTVSLTPSDGVPVAGRENVLARLS
jgi:hypothetical protein